MPVSFCIPLPSYPLVTSTPLPNQYTRTHTDISYNHKTSEINIQCRLLVNFVGMYTCLTLFQIKSKLLVLGAVNTTTNDQGCQHVTGRFEPIRTLLNKPAGWPIFVQSHLTVKTVEWFKKQLSHNLLTYRKEKISDLHKSCENCSTG